MHFLNVEVKQSNFVFCNVYKIRSGYKGLENPSDIFKSFHIGPNNFKFKHFVARFRDDFRRIAPHTVGDIASWALGRFMSKMAFF